MFYPETGLWWLVPVVNDVIEQYKTTSHVTCVFSPAYRHKGNTSCLNGKPLFSPEIVLVVYSTREGLVTYKSVYINVMIVRGFSELVSVSTPNRPFNAGTEGGHCLSSSVVLLRHNP